MINMEFKGRFFHAAKSKLVARPFASWRNRWMIPIRCISIAVAGPRADLPQDYLIAANLWNAIGVGIS